LGVDPKGAETVYLVANYREPNPEIRVKARAILALFDGLGWPWRSAALFRGLPARWLDGVYDLIARNRHRWFGRREACVVPSPEFRDRLLDPPEVEPAPGRREGS